MKEFLGRNFLWTIGIYRPFHSEALTSNLESLASDKVPSKPAKSIHPPLIPDRWDQGGLAEQGSRDGLSLSGWLTPKRGFQRQNPRICIKTKTEGLPYAIFANRRDAKRAFSNYQQPRFLSCARPLEERVSFMATAYQANLF
ncbi:hypothetical protein [Sphingobium yanoikuyae]|uniref:hypothetical protein n=1 Tax=Sphingobium yanoikuyae TaxID=13690 RepID=UPI0028A74943|nr:hypothetical protein [Sphingobium yanoikuyae]